MTRQNLEEVLPSNRDNRSVCVSVCVRVSVCVMSMHCTGLHYMHAVMFKYTLTHSHTFRELSEPTDADSLISTQIVLTVLQYALNCNSFP